MTRLKVKAWSNGQASSSGGGLGVRIRHEDRDQYLDSSQDHVKVELSGTDEITTVRLSDSFWRGCSELRSAAIGRWLLSNGLAPWAKGAPPVLELEMLDDGSFRLEMP